MASKEEEFNLWKEYKTSGDREARRELLFSLKPLIRSQANKYRNSGLPYDSIELEGTRLAAESLETYDPSKAQLNTHVVNNLKKISRFVTGYQNVGRIPEPRALILGKYNTLYANLQDEKGREPTIDELSDALQVPPVEIERIQVEQRADLHMELPSAEEDGRGFKYYVAPELEDPNQRQAINFVYFDAGPVDKKILEYTFGLGGVPKISNKEIKTKLNLTETELKRRRNNLAKQIRDLL